MQSHSHKIAGEQQGMTTYIKIQQTNQIYETLGNKNTKSSKHSKYDIQKQQNSE